MRLTLEGYDKLFETNKQRRQQQRTKKPPIYHTCQPNTNLHKRMFCWFLRQCVLVTNRRSISADLISEKLVGIKPKVLFLLGYQTDLANYFHGISRNNRATRSKSSSLKNLIIPPP